MDLKTTAATETSSLNEAIVSLWQQSPKECLQKYSQQLLWLPLHDQTQTVQHKCRSLAPYFATRFSSGPPARDELTLFHLAADELLLLTFRGFPMRTSFTGKWGFTALEFARNLERLASILSLLEKGGRDVDQIVH